jgi:chaperone modulatory protein CbpM
MVEEGIIEPIGERKTTWRFSFSEVENIRTVIRIKDDLKLNLAGAALALQLLERIEQLESKIALHNMVSK